MLTFTLNSAGIKATHRSQYHQRPPEELLPPVDAAAGWFRETPASALTVRIRQGRLLFLGQASITGITLCARLRCSLLHPPADMQRQRLTSLRVKPETSLPLKRIFEYLNILLFSSLFSVFFVLYLKKKKKDAPNPPQPSAKVNAVQKTPPKNLTLEEKSKLADFCLIEVPVF